MKDFKSLATQYDQQLEGGFTFFGDLDSKEIVHADGASEADVTKLSSILKSFDSNSLLKQLSDLINNELIYFQFKTKEHIHYIAPIGPKLFFGLMIEIKKLNHGRVMTIINNVNEEG